MTNGIDRGFSLLYSRLSFRRKFLRTCWFGPLCLFLVLLLQTTGYLPESLRDFGVAHALEIGWGIVAAFLLLFVAQGGYTFARWRRERTEELAGAEA